MSSTVKIRIVDCEMHDQHPDLVGTYDVPNTIEAFLEWVVKKGLPRFSVYDGAYDGNYNKVESTDGVIMTLILEGGYD